MPKSPIINVNRGLKQGMLGYILTDDEQDREGPHPADIALARRIQATIERHYPAHAFSIQVSSIQGVAILKLLVPGYDRFCGQFGKALKLATLASDPGLKTVIHAAGELLERWGQPRGGFQADRMAEARPMFNDTQHRTLKKIEEPKVVWVSDSEWKSLGGEIRHVDSGRRQFINPLAAAQR